MADGMSIDFSELNKLAADLGEDPTATKKNLKGAVQFTATNIKKEVAAELDGTWSGLAAAVDYDIKADSDGVSADIGYNKGKAGGKAGNLREYGAPNAKAHFLALRGGVIEAVAVPGSPSAPLAPHNDLGNALRANEKDFVHGIEQAIDDSLKRRNL